MEELAHEQRRDLGLDEIRVGLRRATDRHSARGSARGGGRVYSGLCYSLQRLAAIRRELSLSLA